MDERPSWDDYFFSLAEMAATRATCPRAHHACILTKHNRVIGTGYNGSPPGLPHCTDIGCRMAPCEHYGNKRHGESYVMHPDGHCIRTIHAEVNSLINALVPVWGATAYVTGTPCPDCNAALNQAGVTDIRWRRTYP